MDSAATSFSRRGTLRSKRVLLAEALRVTGLEPLLRRLPTWRGLIVLSYHRIGVRSQSELHRGLFSGDREALDREMRLLTRHFDVVSPDQIGPALLATSGRHVVVTFDDGYRDLYEIAHPVLEANGVRAAMFLCTGFVDGRHRAWWDDIAWMLHRAEKSELSPGRWSPRPMALSGPELERTIDAVTRAYWELTPGEEEAFLTGLAAATGTGRRPPAADDWITWEMVRAMKAYGHEIGAHTDSHPVLARLPADRQREEIAISVNRLREEVGERPRLLAYPVGTSGAFDARTIEAAREAGIEFAFSNYGGRITPERFSPFDIRRMPVESLGTQPLFNATLTLPQVLVRASD
jgi:peptidoglycan/xylan/chitin deacetylase (PgdA/CDA1 family)